MKSLNDNEENILDVLFASFGQYFDAAGIIALDIQDDDQVRPLIDYMAQGVADHFLRDGNKLANLIYRMGETAAAANPAPPTSGATTTNLPEISSKLVKATPAQAGAELPDGYLPKESECSELAAKYFYRQGYEDARRGGS